MALIKCPECNKEISDKSNTCVHCGYKLKNNKNYLKIVIVIIIVLVGFSIYLKNSSNDNKKKNSEDLVSCSNKYYYIQKLKGEYNLSKDYNCTARPYSGYMYVSCGTIERKYKCGS